MRIFPFIRRIAAAVGGSASWLANVKPAIAVSTVNSGTLAKPGVNPALVVSGAPSVLKVDQEPAFDVDLLSVTGDVAKPAVNPAPALGTVLTASPVETDIPAFDLVRVQFDLTHRKGGVTATTTGTWTTATNAQGDHGAGFATCAGSVGGATFTLKLSYSDMVAKTSMTLTDVRAIFYSKVTGDTTGLLASVTFERSLNNGTSWATLGTQGGNYDDTASGRSFTLSPDPSWSEVDAIEYRVTVVMAALSAGVTFSLDAIELEVVAAETQNL